MLMSLLLCLLVFVFPIYSWGPATHQTIGSVDLIGRFFAPDSQAFVAGTSAPDGFTYLKPPGWSSQLGPLHSFPFANYLFRYYVSQVNRTDAMYSYILGYGTHLAMDAVAHAPRGYPTCVVGPDMMEVQIDTFVYHNGTKTLSILGDEGCKSVAKVFHDATVSWAAHDPQGFAFGEKDLNAFAHIFDLAQLKEPTILELNVGYDQRMVKWDPFGASTFAETLGHYQLCYQCSVLASLHWIKLATDLSVPLEAIEPRLRVFIADLYNSGRCSPR